jgi:hypothetical protein
VFGELAKRGEVAEIVVPVVTPNLVPSGDHRYVCDQGHNFHR